MPTHCTSSWLWDISDAEDIFIQRSITLLKIIIPASIVYIAWRIRRSNQINFSSTLGLNDIISESEADTSTQISWVRGLIYLAIAITISLELQKVIGPE